ncbi:hypothetical protein D3C87_1612880 [compost metagenome]
MPFRMAKDKLKPFPAGEVGHLREFEIRAGKREVLISSDLADGCTFCFKRFEQLLLVVRAIRRDNEFGGLVFGCEIEEN